MKRSRGIRNGLLFCGLLTLACASLFRAADAAESLTVGSVVKSTSGTLRLTRLSTLPYVDSEYTRRFTFDSFQNPKLRELRERYQLEKVVAPGRDEFDRQVLLMDWVHQQFKRFGRPTAESHGALAILDGIAAGNAYFCAQYEEVLVSTAASLGWVDRPLALRRHQGVAKVGGSTEHSVTEIWSNQFAKWVMLDPTSNMYLEKDGIPLNAFEIRQEWFYHEGTNLLFVIGKDRQKHRKAELPIFLKHFEQFGDLAVNSDELDKYGFIGYIPNTDLLDKGYDYGRMFITKDQLCDGTKWHIRPAPSDPAVDPYFPLGQAELRLFTDEGQIDVRLRTLTPNFLRYEVKFDRGGWEPTPAMFVWPLHAGNNRLEVRTVNRFGVRGPVSIAEFDK